MLNPFSLMPNRKQLIDLVNSIVAEVNQLINGKADKTELDKKLDKTGGNVTGDLSVKGKITIYERPVATKGRLSMPYPEKFIEIDRTVIDRYIAPMDGYLFIEGIASKLPSAITLSVDSKYYVNQQSQRVGGALRIIVPVIKGRTISIYISDAEIRQFRFIPCVSEIFL